jgi:hypothetical protein
VDDPEAGRPKIRSMKYKQKAEVIKKRLEFNVFCRLLSGDAAHG